MVRILSAAIFVPPLLAAIWWLPSDLLLVLAEVVLVLAFIEYVHLAEALGARVPRLVAGTAAVVCCASVGLRLPLELTLLTVLLAVAVAMVGLRAPGPGVLHDVSASLFAALYLGLPLGALVALHAFAGRQAVFLLLLVTILSDTAQYYSGRLFGRHKLSPLISPKKTVEGAVGGFLLTPPLVGLAAHWWLPEVPTGEMLLVVLLLVGLGIAGDLFESLLKRSAGVKDSSGLIPGHGGVLDRIDSLLFAAPAFYLFLKYGA